MFRTANLLSNVKSVILAAALLVYPCGMLAQRGGGGGHMGGGTAGGGGLSGGGGAASGLDVKDDLKDFHAVLAVQASSQQVVEYDLMLKSTAAASSELQALQEKLGSENKRSGIASGGSTLDDAVLNRALEKARAENKKFLDEFSEPQKSGLKETIKKLIKADLELGQQANAFHQQAGDGKAVGPQLAGSAQSLERALASFRSEQLNLGQEMSIVAPATRQEFTLDIPPVKNSVRFANQPISIITSGVISQGLAQSGQNTFALELTADMSDLQQNITAVLRAQLDKADQCGERIAIQTAALMPLAPSSLVAVNVHYERWACLGRETNEIVEGNGAIEVKLTPAIGKDGTLQLVPEITRIDAEGLVRELLRSGSLGEALRDKIAEALLPSLPQGADYKAMLPAAARGDVALHRARFEGTGLGKLSAVLDGEIRVPSDKTSSLTGESKTEASKTNGSN